MRRRSGKKPPHAKKLLPMSSRFGDALLPNPSLGFLLLFLLSLGR